MRRLAVIAALVAIMPAAAHAQCVSGDTACDGINVERQHHLAEFSRVSEERDRQKRQKFKREQQRVIARQPTEAECAEIRAKRSLGDALSNLDRQLIGDPVDPCYP